MLDECKGERMEEVLAAFSSAVLKHVIALETAQDGEHHAPALDLALEERGYKSDNTDLVTMVWAYKASLHHVLRTKDSANAKYRDFSELLSIKERSIARKNETIQALEQNGGKTISDDAKLEMWRTIRNNWSGNERWMEALFRGDSSAKKDTLLETPFDKVWRRVQQGRLAELEEKGSGLLEQLDTRVQTQRQRLEKWEEFRRRLSADRPKPTPSKQKRQDTQTKGIDLGFGAHEGLQVGRASPRKATIGGQKRKLNEEYDDLIHGLNDELSKTKPQESSALAFLQRPATSDPMPVSAPMASIEKEEEVVSELEEEEEHFTEAPIKPFKTRLDMSKRLPVRPKISHNEDSFAARSLRSSSSSRNLRKFSEDEARIMRVSSLELTSSPEPEDSSEHEDDPTVQPSSPHVAHQEKSPEPTPREPSPTQELADQIIESMNQASPSPVKRPRPRHTLSLVERTRLSMARESFAFPDHEEPDLPIIPAAVSAPPILEDSSQSIAEEASGDLLARTRKSMAGFEKARQKAQIERRRSLRRSKLPPRREGSYFPKVDEEEDREQQQLAEDLLAGEDMEAVFRSRPKIAASPLPSPTREGEANEYM